MKRNRQQTEKRIVDAAIGLLAEEGFQSFGVNAVAARAGVDKVLIYRYFSGLDGLLEFIGKTEVLFPSAAAMLDSDLPSFYRNFCRALADNPLGACVQNWERVADNPLTQSYRRQRDQFWQDARELLKPQDDAAASLLSLLAAVPLGSIEAADVTPLLAASAFDPVEAPPAPAVESTEAERLADNLL
ncbi:TetR/AcrR family transcriptional regulator [Cerasicoccus maritimus]|uniref:TetR/AcrR family transcriptional regulator n=1 Tax=Cerasicoccus maritimus TaxID=490089 RepID=UPI002852AFA3|nr:helix-turn-helix domain-containing protein [Cerasicoccus maritimus]